MNDSMEKFLLAMLLTIRELENPLNSKEKDTLYLVAQQLFLRRNTWDTNIKSNLIKTTLSRQFSWVMGRLRSVNKRMF